jgi:hypothetical protein
MTVPIVAPVEVGTVEGTPVAPVLIRYRAMGFTDDVTTCDFCGREELKGTVRLVAVDPDGEESGETFGGADDAAARSGRPAAEIRLEAQAADHAAQTLWTGWNDARRDAMFSAVQAFLDAHGLERRFATVKQARSDAGVVTAIAAWDATHPEPTMPETLRKSLSAATR